PVYVASGIAFGVGWNFVYVGGAVLLSTTHDAAERGKTQGVNDLAMFILATIGSIAAAPLLQGLGWKMLHLASLLPIGLVAISLLLPSVILRSRRPLASGSRSNRPR